MSDIYRIGSYGCIYRYGQEVIKKNKSKDQKLFGIDYPTEYDITSRLCHQNLLHANRITPEGHLVFNYYPYTLEDANMITLPNNLKLKLVSQLLSAVSYLHHHGYLHLDIKLNNILVTGDATKLVLADFGSSLYVGAGRLAIKQSSRERIGDYLKSPELLQNKINEEAYLYRPADDYWSLGISLLEFFQVNVSSEDSAEKIFKTRRRQFQEKMALFSETPEELRPILRSLLAWQWSSRRLPIEENPIDFRRHPINYSFGYYYHHSQRKEHLARCWSLLQSQIIENGDDSVEAFFLAIDLYYRSLQLVETSSNYSQLLITCYWMALKLMKGCRVDIREVSYEDTVKRDLSVAAFSQLENKILHHLRGELYLPNMFTSAKSSRELLCCQLLTSPSSNSFDLSYFRGKNLISLRLFAFYQDKINSVYV